MFDEQIKILIICNHDHEKGVKEKVIVCEYENEKDVINTKEKLVDHVEK